MDNIKPNNTESQPTDLAPLNVIRTETVLSKLPIHNLTKRGSVDIHIDRKNEAGEVELRWKVDPNPSSFAISQRLPNLTILGIGLPISSMRRLITNVSSL